MLVETTIAGLRTARRGLVGTLGLVPTMGALHEGHLSLVRAAKASCDAVAVSIFVNPAQFAPNEDFSKYPRTFEQDCRLLKSEGVDLVFAPAAEEMYRAGETTRIHVGPVGDRLDGSSRPGHFLGVATIVAKLFHIFAPQRAYFGQKDAVQVAVLRQMVRDLDFDLDLVVAPIVRDQEGLALSSRNQYLSTQERKQALVLSRALAAGVRVFERGDDSSAGILSAAAAVLDEEPGVRLDYLALVDHDTLIPVDAARSGNLLAVAALVGATRLIDNVIL